MIQGYEKEASSLARKTMRNMNIHPREAVLPDGLIMSGSEFTRNIVAYRDQDATLVRTNDVPFDHNVADFNSIWHRGLPVKTGQRGDWASWQALGMDRHSRIADPRFVDPDHADFRLQGDSPAFDLGFKPSPVESIGPYKDELRASWPIIQAPGAREHPVKPPG
jgi:hypothetical protein